VNTIGLDARKAFDFGIGTYIRNLPPLHAPASSPHRYVVFEGDDPVSVSPGNPAIRLVPLALAKYSVGELIRFAPVVRRHNLDLVHFPHYVLPFGLSCRVVVTIHDLIHVMFPEALPSRAARLYARVMLWRALRRADAVITVSQASREAICGHFRVPHERIRVIYNGVDERFRPLEPDRTRAVLEGLGADRSVDRSEFRRAPPLDRPYFLHVGELARRKNIGRLLTAFALACRQGLVSNLVFVGQTPEQVPLVREMLRHHPDRDRMVFTGHLLEEQLPALYNGALALVVASLYEGFGLPLLEAMACGTPAIASKVGALPEVSGEAALGIDPYSPEEIAAALLRMEGDAGLRENLSALGRERARDFSWERCRQETLAVYEELL
jgi:glycosyltransferase involved in cell wall biosynthesis